MTEQPNPDSPCNCDATVRCEEARWTASNLRPEICRMSPGQRRLSWWTSRASVALGLFATVMVVGLHDVTATPLVCGDCDRNGQLSVSELVTAVKMSLNGCHGTDECCGDCDSDGTISISELIGLVRRFLNSDPLAACGLDCYLPCYGPGGTACPCQEFACLELPEIMDGDRTIRCNTSLCYENDDQLRSCVLLIHHNTALCVEE